ncbi:MAG: TonB-dependent receptor [Bacteroidota bacterium]
MSTFIRLDFILLFILCLAVTAQVTAQDFTLSGYLRDESSGEELLFATVAVEGSDQGVTTNLYGFYSLTLPAGKYRVNFSYVGYDPQVLEVNLDKDLTQDVELASSAQQLEEIVVVAEQENENVTNTEVSVVSLDVKQIKKIPVIFGEQDILKTMQLMPGVSANSEGGSGFFVRGGDADQNLILLDEAPVYNASHLLGFFSVFNSEALKDVKLYKGGIPAQYGGRASSVMDVRMKNGNMKEWKVSGGLGLISSRLTVEGPIVEDKGSLIVSGRRTYADILARPFLEDDQQTDLYFYDVNFKANYKLGEKDRIYVSGYLGRDVLGTDDFGFDWGNQTLTARWNHTFNNKLFSNTSFIYSKYDYGFNVDNGGIEVDLSAGILDYNLKQDFNYYLNPNNSITFGWQAIYHEFTPTTFTFDEDPASIAQDQYALEGGIYISNEQKIGDKLSLNYGLRLSSFSNIGAYTEQTFNQEDDVINEISYESGDFYNTYFQLEPRFSATYLLNPSSSFKLSYNRNAQYIHLLSNSNAGSPTDIWIPSTNLVEPTIADQYAVGYFRNFNNNNYKFSVEAYYKDLQNTVDYEDGAEIFGNANIESELVFVVGRAYGVEFLLEKTKGKFTGWLSYTLSKTERRFDEINNGEWFSARQDRTHDISIVGVYQLTPKLSISASWIYYTGDAVTFPAGKYFVDGNLVNLFSERNGDRLPDYHRLDLGATWLIKKRDRYKSELNFSIYNAYHRLNAFSINFDTNDAGVTEATRLALFGIVPSVTWNFEF